MFYKYLSSMGRSWRLQPFDLRGCLYMQDLVDERAETMSDLELI
jgi:hypothetical protein